ncbi:hypothetical protein CCAX7_44310 [Capsulimonas corticalis]|uniref:Uncharacterized protein n=1 Tax=Capsulimonas corticalis TaxID=2219043 RepID=A0A402CX59_9BACT|nr:tetratricopeptide repeat protein [Capsulimonas corticalis]BDI32380.1 hypothetical protein CCAX7_44310 [Capsulimonas corticalis]
MTDWQLGLRAFREGRMREATDRLRNAAGDRERTVTQGVRFQTLAFLGASLYALGHAAEAVTAFEDACRLSFAPGPPADLSVNLANSYLAVGRRDDAKRALQQALRAAPGHVEARMMLQRLENSPDDQPLVGSVLGETPEGVKAYLRTLSFARVASGGYDPAQVRQALSQMERYIDFLSAQIEERDATIASDEVELERYRKMEDVMIEKMMLAQSDPTALHIPHQISQNGEANGSSLSPIELLFQKKS